MLWTVVSLCIQKATPVSHLAYLLCIVLLYPPKSFTQETRNAYFARKCLLCYMRRHGRLLRYKQRQNGVLDHVEVQNLLFLLKKIDLDLRIPQSERSRNGSSSKENGTGLGKVFLSFLAQKCSLVCVLTNKICGDEKSGT